MEMPNGEIIKPYHCFAAFLGRHLEHLTCFNSERQVVLEFITYAPPQKAPRAVIPPQGTNKNIKIEKEIGSGAFASVYRGLDLQLNRPIAVKIVRASAELVSSAHDHAKALARAKHPNVVSVYGITRVADPKTGSPCDAIIMELVDGPTLEARLKGPHLSMVELRTICEGLIDGVEHIHVQGLTHEDLHEENVLLDGTTVKIIDIMYRTTLGQLSTASRQSRIRRDLANLRGLLEDLFAHSDLSSENPERVAMSIQRNASIQDIRAALAAKLSPVTLAGTGEGSPLQRDHPWWAADFKPLVAGYDTLHKDEKLARLEAVASVRFGDKDDFVKLNFAAWFLDRVAEFETDSELRRKIRALRADIDREGLLMVAGMEQENPS